MARLKAVRTAMVEAARSVIEVSAAKMVVGGHLAAIGGASTDKTCIQTPYNDVRSLFFYCISQIT